MTMVETVDNRVALPLPVDPGRDGWRADRYLSAHIPRLSRSRARCIIEAGDLLRGTRPLKPSSRVRGGEELVLWRTLPHEPPAPTRFDVLFDDGALLAIDKPSGLAIHPTARYFRTTLTQVLRRRAGDGPVPVPCHRLDRETSGVLLLAWDRVTERRIKVAFSQRRIRKTYWALVEGRVSESCFTVDEPLAQGRSPIRIKMVPGAGGQLACTRFEVLRFVGERTLVACYPQTGRTHQIRAHLSWAGHPIVGDKIYGIQGESWFLRWADGGEQAAPLSELAWSRQCLHARAVELTAELLGAPVRIEAPWARDLPPLQAG